MRTDSVNYADSGDIKTLVQFSGSPILKILLNFWNCVGGTHMPDYFIIEITEYFNLITVVILFDFGSTHAIFNPVIFDFGSVFH